MRSARLALGLVVSAALLAACTPPVRFATQAEIKQATATPSPTPASGGGTTQLSLAQLQAAYRAIATQVTPSVVEVGSNTGVGAGIVMDANGNIVTNAHVVGPATTFQVTSSTGSKVDGRLVGVSAANDIAVVRITPDASFKPATFADSAGVHVGDIVVSLGDPTINSVSNGIVSATGKTQAGAGGVSLANLIQTTTALGQNDAGGALSNINAQVVGMPTVAGSAAGSAGNVTMAIPSNQVLSVARQLIGSGATGGGGGGGTTAAGSPYLGVSVTSAPNGGATIASVSANSPAQKGGLQAGWVITRVGVYDVADAAGVAQAVNAYKPGDKVGVVLKLPDGSGETIIVTLAARPATP